LKTALRLDVPQRDGAAAGRKQKFRVLVSVAATAAEDDALQLRVHAGHLQIHQRDVVYVEQHRAVFESLRL
jgi:hypothetical protein